MVYKFLFDVDRCINCRACDVACKQQNDVEIGVRWRRVNEIESGKYPNPSRRFLSLACFHCSRPYCMAACPMGAIYQRADGIVVTDKNKCIGCGYCMMACPFGVPEYGRDGLMEKCIGCYPRIDKGLDPACVHTCLAGALAFGTQEEIAKIKRERAAVKLVVSP
ncbi:MAG: 4Fe-4S dicluster domain-containing protein [Methanophagales archaeon]|nr:4Fe-4S dicluster domain-containing protein [Methanophagales archaeon]